MGNYKRVVLWGTIAVVLLTAAIVVLFLNLSDKGGRGSFTVSSEEVSVYNGVPSDAVVIIDFKHLGEYAPLLQDTSSFACGILDKDNALVRFQHQLLGYSGISNVPMLQSLHYSAKNSVSFLQVACLKGADTDGVRSILQGAGNPKRRYNDVVIYTLPDGLYAALHMDLLLASTSSYVLESSIRHLENNTSILDNSEFEHILGENGASSAVYINHNQIGKLFSGAVARDFLGYSDFVMKFASWSCFPVTVGPGKLVLSGEMHNGEDESRFSNLFGDLNGRKTAMGKVLPSSVVFAVSLPVSSMHDYLKGHRLYLEMQKKVGSFAYMQKVAKGDNGVEPRAWVDSLEIEELVSAYCKFGEKCEWLTLVRGKQSFGINNVISAVVDRDKVEEPRPFRYKGYIASVFGELFSHCSEEYMLKLGPWTVLGPKKILDDFANGSAIYFNLEDYLSQTPVKDFLGKEASVKILANIKEGGDSVLKVLKPYPAAALARQLQQKNFGYVVADIQQKEGQAAMDIEYYSTMLEKLPQPKVKESDVEMNFAIDSTISLPEGPYMVKDVAKKSDAYLEQLPNMRLRYMDANKKGVWAIPFDTPICGYVEQVDLYNNGRLQMLFVSGNKVYLLDRMGRFVYGYPAKLQKGVVLGPSLLEEANGHKYSFVVLNSDNTVSWYDISGKRMEGFKDLVSPEFIKELPELVKIGGIQYWILKAPSQLLVFTKEGERLEFAEKERKKKIDRESEVVFASDGVFKIKCTDGKEYLWTLATGKLKRL